MIAAGLSRDGRPEQAKGQGSGLGVRRHRDDACGGQRGQGLGVDAGHSLQNRGGVLAQHRWRRIVGHWRIGQFDRAADRFEVGVARMRDGDAHGARRDLRFVERLRDAVDRADRHTAGMDARDPRIGGVGQEMGGEPFDDRFPIRDAIGVAGEARIAGQIGQADRLAQRDELRIIAAGDHEIAVRGAEDLIGHDIGVSVAISAGCLAGGQVILALVAQHRDLHVEQRHIDMLAEACRRAVQQRGLDRDDRIEAGHQVRYRDADLLRAAAWQIVALAGDAHQPAERLNDEVIARLGGARPGLAEAGDRTIDQAGVQRAQAGMVEAVFRQRPRLVILDQHIALRHHRADQRLSFCGGDVDRDRLFAAVGRLEIRGFACRRAIGVRHPGRSPLARIIPAAGMFDLDDLRAQIRQRLRAPWPRQHAAHVEHSQSRQRTHVAILSRPSVGSMPAVYRGSASDRASCCKGLQRTHGEQMPQQCRRGHRQRAERGDAHHRANLRGAPGLGTDRPQNGEQHDRHHWHDHDGQVARCQRGDHYRQDRARGKGGGGENRGLHGARSAVVGKAQFVTAMRAQRVMRHHLFGDRLCQRGRDAAADVDGGEFPCRHVRYRLAS
ncbi:hypothetical protein WR25_05610 [Diploscapter pachys]|uniref:Uncharacterized protein n=1 Tax=Diploscapter pachys TaxID=2018661 RepID=A0A2A2M2S4_9BILA|nr:hypothetical protein WR25_05610 [Diploscapter pachys]